MKRDNWPVGDNGVSPAGKPDECFYCHEKVGEPHKADCVIRERTVVVAVTLNLVMTMPESWSPESIEFKLNDSSSCANNILHDIQALHGRLDSDVAELDCACSIVEAKFLREATAEDERAQGLFVANSES